MQLDKEQEELYIRAKRRVEELKSFYTHLFMYVLVNSILIAINLITSPNDLWFYFPLLGWGIGILAHFFSVVLGGKWGSNWEDKKIRELMEKDKKRYDK